MYNKKRLLILKITALIFSILCLFVFISASSYMTLSAREYENYGLFTKIDISISGRKGAIIARVTNKFTLGNSDIKVYVYLYSSETYQEDYNLMKLESSNNTSDLDKGQELEAWVTTKGAQKYWCAVMRYKFGENDFFEKQTKTILFDKDGREMDLKRRLFKPPFCLRDNFCKMSSKFA